MQIFVVILILLAILIGLIYLNAQKKNNAVNQIKLHKKSSQTFQDPQKISEWLIGFASQAGFAEQLATQTAQMLKQLGISVTLQPLHTLSSDRLAHFQHALFVVSTFGEGEPPDHARTFLKRMNNTENLQNLQFGLLALGDKQYETFCGFGRTLDAWLQKQGAQPLFKSIEVDNGDQTALNTWKTQLTAFGSSSQIAMQTTINFEPVYERWHLVERRLLNPGSCGNPVFHIELEPAEALSRSWKSGDLIDIKPRYANDATPLKPLPSRQYSISSIAEEGRIHLLVRQVKHGGTLGLGSGWLTEYLKPGDAFDLTLRSNKAFHLPSGDYPLILIGNGTGIAGLRSHLKARIHAGYKRNWLFFGERNQACDFYYRDEIEAWYTQGMLENLDLAFSRDQPERIYVQDRLRTASDRVKTWIAEGAVILVCGSLEGMAPAVENVLADILGSSANIEQLSEEGRYLRDVY
ncbi:MAG: sulfite reductase subunit alpha [Pseudomonadota bacterium]